MNEEVEKRRRQVEQRLDELRASLRREVGFAPRKKHLLMVLVALAGGLAVAMSWKAGGRRRRLQRPPAHELPRT